ncbi:nucleotidyltransferase family protein [Salinigranum rubrum]|uniref:Nucleotidyltransferase family protein n=1 Tax=Salinigranum rubrum TaxID=755307 RepID=A0A2I8VKH2_9EURY|nr:nucleotidyltransferase family protein [Salinigranum rubrum]AUV82430.1 nucleotidyltransferase family protein [Salinigranum rubrum]
MTGRDDERRGDADARGTDGDPRGEGLPVVHPPTGADATKTTEATEPTGDDPAPRVAGVLLAAGTSSRFGAANKLLASLDGDPLVRHAARTLVDAGLDPLVAVVGHDGDRVAAALDGLGFTVVVNPDYEEGQATSVRRGVEALTDDREGERVDAVVFALGDMPAVAPESVRALVDVFRTGEWTALAAAFEGKRGNPVLFDRRHVDALTDVSGDRGGRRILREGERSALVETGDEGVRHDVDTPADLDRR